MSKSKTKETTRSRGDWADKVIACIESGLAIKDACKRARISRAEFYRRRDTDEDFAKRVRFAYEEKNDTLEAEAFRRAVTGVSKPIFHQGAKVGSVKEYSDTLLTILLKANMPAKYRDMKFEHSGKLNHDHKHAIDLSACTDEELEFLERIATRIVQSGTDSSGATTSGGGSGSGGS